MDKHHRLLVIIPAYNEEESLEATVDELVGVAPSVDYLVVNDGSKDLTERICRDRGYNYVTLPVNSGLTVGFQTGMKYALRNGYDYALQFDADGQHMPEYIDEMLETAINENADNWLTLPPREKGNLRSNDWLTPYYSHDQADYGKARS